ncbi:glutathione S-transferase [Actibacterium pelagium]|uniref:Glutathione S-transferase n=1 Tax=Actibacterium pelagium TaxID=2029103 RepID=A0A917A9I2_9RHOB|nr:glutathione S-transferase [Actibacterium pelagium]GGE36946.1 glutathione S-transferase [Actibacterium pelagium]
MKLFHTPASPYGRKVMVAALETGQTIEVLSCAPSPVNRDQSIVSFNPTGKVPTAILEDGSALYDSRVITRWLDTQHKGPKLYPNEPDLWTVLRREALAEGLIDAALLIRYETASRPPNLVWSEWLQGQMDKIGSSLEQMEREATEFGGVDAALIATACALSYLEFRIPKYQWRESHPKLQRWFAEFSKRPSMQQTHPRNL